MPDDQGGAPYARIYATLARDHPRVWSDPSLLGWYVRLLLPADRAWPGLADLPRGIPDDALDALIADECVDLVGDHSYRFHGLDRERIGRRGRGAAGGIARATGAGRDRWGRFAGGFRSDAGSSLDNGAGYGTLDAPATSETKRERVSTGTPDRVPVDTVESPKPTRAPAREAERVDCDDYQGHLGDHRWFEGVGWKCLACERSKAAQEPTFSEKVQAQGGDPF